MPSFHLKRNCNVYLVTSVYGTLQKFKLAVYPDLSFSQTFDEQALNVKTLHDQDAMFESAVINKANPANFSFTILLVNSTDHIAVGDMLTKKNTARDGSVEALYSGDLYIDTGVDIFKLTKCVFERGTYQIQRDSITTVSVSGSASKLEKWATTGTAIPGITGSVARSFEGIIPRAVNVVLDSIQIPNIATITLELANEVQWLDYDTLHKSLAIIGPTDTMYPEAFVVSSKTLSGTIQQYVTSANESRLQSWSTSSTLTIQVGDVGTYYFNVYIPSVVFTNRLDTQEAFLQTYDFRMNSNPSDLSTVIQSTAATSAPPSGYSQFFVEVTSTGNGYLGCSTIKLLDSSNKDWALQSNGGIATTVGYTANLPGYPVTNVNDGNDTTFTTSSSSTGAGTGHGIQIALSGSQAITKFGFRSRSDGYGDSESPRNMNLYGRLTSGDPWTLLLNVSLPSGLSPNTYVEYNLP